LKEGKKSGEVIIPYIDNPSYLLLRKAIINNLVKVKNIE